jgi:S-ribosylhomocysteine lyase
MEKIASFQVNHLKLKPGLYVSRQDKFGDTILTTFDMRFTEPNKEPVIDQPALHTIEHLGATFLRNDKEWADKTVYFGPMGCRTGFYVIFEGKRTSREVSAPLLMLMDWIIEFDGDIPGAKPSECGNYSEQNLNMAKWYASRYRKVLYAATQDTLEYPK